MNKLRPLLGQIRAVAEHDGYGVLWYLTDGHAVKKDFVDEMRIDWHISCEESNVHHTYARYTPTLWSSDYDSILNLVKEPARGAFKVTYIDADDTV